MSWKVRLNNGLSWICFKKNKVKTEINSKSKLGLLRPQYNLTSEPTASLNEILRHFEVIKVWDSMVIIKLNDMIENEV